MSSCVADDASRRKVFITMWLNVNIISEVTEFIIIHNAKILLACCQVNHRDANMWVDL